MACELLGAKMIAPYYGNSLYVWTSVLATTLGGLTTGYFLGGVISEKFPNDKTLKIILLVSTIFFGLMPLTSAGIMERTMSMTVQTGSLISCMLFIFPQLVCFGMVSPMLIRLISEEVKTTGHTAGTVYGISTVGGIILTFLIGFYLIPQWGLKASVYSTAISLGVITLIYFIAAKKLLPLRQNQSAFRKFGTAKQFQTTERKPPLVATAKTFPNKNLLYAIAFLEGAAVMSVEIFGAKMLAPFYGTSLIVWTSVIAVTLLSLTAGYFLGGFFSTKKNPLPILFYVLTLSALLMGGMTPWSHILFNALEDISIYSGTVLCSLSVLGPPLILLGATSPIIIQCLADDVSLTGKSAGTVYAVSTAGGILFTLLIGFVIIPAWGITRPLLMLATSLLIISFFLLKYVETKKLLVTCSAILIFIIQSFVVLSKNESKKLTNNISIPYSTEGLMGQLKVLDIKDAENNFTHRQLLINGVMQTHIINHPLAPSYWKYVHLISLYSSLKRGAQSALLCGFGGGSIARELSKMNMKVDAVEIDSRMLNIAKKYFYFDDSTTQFFADDARHYINTTKKKYDLMVFDVLNGEVQPSYIFTTEGFSKMKKLLNEEGMIIIEFQELKVNNQLLAYESIFNTLKTAGYQVYYSLNNEDADDAMDIILIASLTKINFGKLNEDDFNKCCKHQKWLADFLKQPVETRKDLFPEAELLTDDKPILEHLTAETQKRWREKMQEGPAKTQLMEGRRLFK